MVSSIKFPNNNPAVWVRMFVPVCSFGLALALGEGHSRWKRALDFMCKPNFFSGISRIITIIITTTIAITIVIIITMVIIIGVIIAIVIILFSITR